MKHTLLTLGFATLALTGANATTVTATGGTTGAQFITSTGTILTSGNTSIAVGRLTGDVFTQFAPSDISPPTLGSAGALLGRWSGNAADASNVTASPFNGAVIVFRLTTTANGGGVAYFSNPANVFPTANSGVGDNFNYSASALNTVNSLSSPNSAAFRNDNAAAYPNGYVTVGVVPEPSAALLGAVGALGLLRRRRN